MEVKRTPEEINRTLAEDEVMQIPREISSKSASPRIVSPRIVSPRSVSSPRAGPTSPGRVIVPSRANNVYAISAIHIQRTQADIHRTLAEDEIIPITPELPPSPTPETEDSIEMDPQGEEQIGEDSSSSEEEPQDGKRKRRRRHHHHHQSAPQQAIEIKGKDSKQPELPAMSNMTSSPLHHTIGVVTKSYKTPEEIYRALTEIGVSKSHFSITRSFILSILAGAYIGMGGHLAITVAGGTPLPNYPGLSKFIFGAVFPVALILISLVGGELFTGNSMYMFLGVAAGKVTWYGLLRTWVVSFIGNYLGCAFFAALFGWGGDFFVNDPWLTFVQNIAINKVSLNWGVAVIRAIGCNWLVNLAIVNTLASTDIAGKILGIWWPIFAFATCGFEHVIANMYFLTLGHLHNAPGVDLAKIWGNNLIPVAIGNIIGGGFFVAICNYICYLTQTRIDVPLPGGFVSKMKLF